MLTDVHSADGSGEMRGLHKLPVEQFVTKGRDLRRGKEFGRPLNTNEGPTAENIRTARLESDGRISGSYIEFKAPVARQCQSNTDNSQNANVLNLEGDAKENFPRVTISELEATLASVREEISRIAIRVKVSPQCSPTRPATSDAPEPAPETLHSTCEGTVSDTVCGETSETPQSPSLVPAELKAHSLNLSQPLVPTSEAPEEVVKKIDYDPLRDQWSSSLMTVKIDSKLIASGKRHECLMLKESGNGDRSFVLKFSWSVNDANTVLDGIKQQALGSYFAKKFCEVSSDHCRPQFLPCSAFLLLQREGTPCIRGEALAPEGCTRRSLGLQKEESHQQQDTTDYQSNWLAAFQIFAYRASGKSVLFNSVQQVGQFWSEPEIFFNPGVGALLDLGTAGIKDWESKLQRLYGRLTKGGEELLGIETQDLLARMTAAGLLGSAPSSSIEPEQRGEQQQPPLAQLDDAPSDEGSPVAECTGTLQALSDVQPITDIHAQMTLLLGQLKQRAPRSADHSPPSPTAKPPSAPAAVLSPVPAPVCLRPSPPPLSSAALVKLNILPSPSQSPVMTAPSPPAGDRRQSHAADKTQHIVPGQSPRGAEQRHADRLQRPDRLQRSDEIQPHIANEDAWVFESAKEPGPLATQALQLATTLHSASSPRERPSRQCDAPSSPEANPTRRTSTGGSSCSSPSEHRESPSLHDVLSWNDPTSPPHLLEEQLESALTLGQLGRLASSTPWLPLPLISPQSDASRDLDLHPVTPPTTSAPSHLCPPKRSGLPTPPSSGQTPPRREVRSCQSLSASKPALPLLPEIELADSPPLATSMAPSSIFLAGSGADRHACAEGRMAPDLLPPLSPLLGGLVSLSACDVSEQHSNVLDGTLELDGELKPERRGQLEGLLETSVLPEVLVPTLQ